MATDASFIEYVAEQSSLAGRLTYKKMFGEYALYLDGKVVAFVCDNSVFIKPFDSTSALTKAMPQRPPYPGAKLYPVADEYLDDSAKFRQLLLATEKAAPPPKPKAIKKVAKN